MSEDTAVKVTGSIAIDVGEIVLAVNEDASKLVRFNPGDVAFAERFYALTRDFQKKLVEYETRYRVLDKETKVDADHLPVNMDKRIGLMRDICEYIKSRIDSVFGDGTSQAVFGDALTLEMFDQFFEGVSPYFDSARERVTKKYMVTSQPKPTAKTTRRQRRK